MRIYITVAKKHFHKIVMSKKIKQNHCMKIKIFTLLMEIYKQKNTNTATTD